MPDRESICLRVLLSSVLWSCALAVLLFAGPQSFGGDREAARETIVNSIGMQLAPIPAG